MRRLILQILITSLLLAGCGVAESSSSTADTQSQSHQAPTTGEQLISITQIVPDNGKLIHPTGAALSTESQIMPTAEPLYLLQPQKRGEQYIIETRAFAMEHDQVITIPKGKEVIFTDLKVASTYRVDYNPTILHSNQTDLSVPSAEGWVFLAQETGSTKVVIMPIFSCNLNGDCPLHPPVRFIVTIRVQ